MPAKPATPAGSKTKKAAPKASTKKKTPKKAAAAAPVKALPSHIQLPAKGKERNQRVSAQKTAEKKRKAMAYKKKTEKKEQDAAQPVTKKAKKAKTASTKTSAKKAQVEVAEVEVEVDAEVEAKKEKKKAAPKPVVDLSTVDLGTGPTWTCELCETTIKRGKENFLVVEHLQGKKHAKAVGKVCRGDEEKPQKKKAAKQGSFKCPICEITVATSAKALHLSGKTHDHLKNKMAHRYLGFHKEQKKGDWFCPGAHSKCMAHNFANNKLCHKCELPKPKLPQKGAAFPAAADYAGSRARMLVLLGLYVEQKKREWVCKRCLQNNAGTDPSCPGCDKARKQCEHKPEVGLF